MCINRGIFMSEYIDDIEITDDVFKIFYQEATEEEKE